MKAYFKRNKTAFLLSLLYFIPGIVWVLFSDRWLGGLPVSEEAARVQQIHNIRDASFVVGISVMIFFLMRVSRKKLNNTRAEYEALFDNHPQPMWIYEIETLQFRAVNKAALSQYGFSRKEFLDFTLKDIRPEEDIPLLENYMNNYQTGDKGHGVWHHRKKNGEVIIVDISANDVTFFRKPCRLVCATDITERFKREEENRRLSLVAENATNSVLILDDQSRIEWVNQSFTKLTGYTIDEVIGRRPSEFLHGPETDDALLEKIMQKVTSGKAFAGEILNYRKDGSSFWLRLTVAPVYTGRKITNYIAIQTDITAIKEQNNRLRDIAYTASHGFRKPLANILGLVELINTSDCTPDLINNLKRSAEELDREVKVIVHKTALIE
ncbi:PAS domain S-box protein [Sediminibacterium soli]|uniref:PAS domain S-box protein n=1 Tax=Sediminibacterium soli TaxID=2698829 RepID=UPI001379CC2A|nr:PAS domain S-box protein [Sediminibacterium soli]NCI46545.1 PAS domain S-box protein [Sediminibacterium soli]